MIKDMAKYIRETRQKTGMTQVEFAEFLGVKPSTVGCYETDRIKPSVEIFLKIQEVAEKQKAA